MESSDTGRSERPDPVVEAYKRDVDRTLFDRTLALSHSGRLEQLQRFVTFLAEVGAAGQRRTGDHGDPRAD